MKKIGYSITAVCLAAFMSLTPWADAENGGRIVAEAHSGRSVSYGCRGEENAGCSEEHHHRRRAHSYREDCRAANFEASRERSCQRASENTDLKNLDLVFDADYYYENNPDLQEIVGRDEERLREHFLNNGMAEGRRGCGNFDVKVYKEKNPDLEEAFEDKLPCYYEHYRNLGCAEGRICHE